MGWISVEDGLPETDMWEEVIICCAGGIVTYADFWPEEDGRRHGFWKDRGEYCEREYWDVTHWMPLPAPP